jgi:hypothetical protein
VLYYAAADTQPIRTLSNKSTPAISYPYAYLVGTLIFDDAWLACYMVRKSHRRQTLWGPLVSASMVLATPSCLHIGPCQHASTPTAEALLTMHRHGCHRCDSRTLASGQDHLERRHRPFPCANLPALLRSDLILLMLIGGAVFTILYRLPFLYFFALRFERI